jgi:hypothetical protein
MAVEEKDFHIKRKKKRSQSSKDNMSDTIEKVGNMLTTTLKEALDNLNKVAIETVTSEK